MKKVMNTMVLLSNFITGTS